MIPLNTHFLKKVPYLALTLEPKVLQSQSLSLYFYLCVCVCACECTHMLSVCTCSQNVEIGDQILGSRWL